MPKRHKHFHYQVDDQRIIANISPAAEPEDVLWTNLGQDYS